MKRIAAPLTVLLALANWGSLSAAPARFWISESKTSPGVPGAPTISAAIGRQRTLYIWAQPATDSNGAFRELDSFSLDIATLDASLQLEPSPFIDFVNGTFKIENPTVISSQKRFQFTTDSSRHVDQGGPLLSEVLPEDITAFAQADAIIGLQGVSPFANPVAVGIGHNSDPYRVGSGSNAAWRVGEFSFQALQSSGTNDLYLQIGWAGMRHEGDGQGNPVLTTQAVFGDDTTPIYNASSLSHRQTSLGGDTFDLRINAIPYTPGDYNGDGDFGPEDLDAWQTSYGQSVAAPGDGGDGNRDGMVNAADYVMSRKLMASGGSAMSVNGLGSAEPIAVPEPTTIVPGSVFFLLMWFGARQKVGHRGAVSVP